LIVLEMPSNPEVQLAGLSERVKVVAWQDLLNLDLTQDSQSQLAVLRCTLKPEQLATIIYVPETNGQLEGVMLSHANLAGNALATFAELPDLGWGAQESALSFLPLTHVFARLLLYGHIYYGHSIYFSDPNRVLRHLQSVQPTILATVPLLLEKVYGQVLERGRKLKSGWQRLIFAWALAVVRHYELGQSLNRVSTLRLKVADWLVLRHWRSLFGGRLKYLLSGGAALKPELANAFAAAGLPILQGYGLTQTSGVACFNRPSHNRAGSVGTPIPGLTLAIAADGEILLQGRYITAGYYKNPTATQGMIDAQGWLHTGDLGIIAAAGGLQITSRKKALFKLSTGKYIAPQPVEARLQQSSLVAQALVVGDQQKFCGALIFPDLKILSDRAGQTGLYLPTDSLLQHPCILGWYQTLVDAANCHLPYWAIVKRFRLVNAELTVSNQLLTESGQVNRQQASVHFAAEISALYGETKEKKTKRRSPSPPAIQGTVDLTELGLGDATCPTTPAPACPTFAQSLDPRFTT
jgi:long-chain acyl-CoA synthetase